MPTRRVVGFSGGIDSQACALWVRNRFPAEEIVLLFADTGWEDAVTYDFIRRYSEKVFPVTIVTPRISDSPAHGVDSLSGRAAAMARSGLAPDDVLNMERLALLKGKFPKPGQSFCTTHLKLYPTKRWVRENLIDPDPAVTIEHYVGIRADESPGRARMREKDWDEFFDCPVYRPLLMWTKDKCFEFVADHGEECNPLYKMGHWRVGCSPCHQSGKDHIRAWSVYRPDEVQKVRDAERRTGRPFMRPVVPGQSVNWIDDVIAWSKTAHGGKVFELSVIDSKAQAGECSSKYGLCE